jgi:copper transport protein
VLLTTRRPRGAAHRTTFGALARALLCTVLCAMLTVLGSAAPASAHAVQTDSTPAEGSVVSSAPKEVTLTFSEGISMSDGSIRVLAPNGKPVDKGKVRVIDGSSVKRGVGLKSGIPKGTYTFAWKAVSADSHPVGGAFTFSVGAPSATSAHIPKEGEDSSTGVVDVLYQSGRYAAFAGFIVLVGGALFVLACWPRAAATRRLQRLVVAGWMTLTGATLLLLLLRNSYTGSGQLGEILDIGALKTVLGTKPGAALASRLLLLGTAAVILAVLFGSYGSRAQESEDGEKAGKDGKTAKAAESGGSETKGDEGESRDLALGIWLGGGVVAVGIATTWAMSEHASTGLQAELAMPVDVIHLLAVAAWLGGLAALLTTLHWGPLPARSVVQRFSQIAFGSVIVLAATGVYQSWRQLGSFSALTGTSYGQLLMIKVALVALLVGVASISRRWVMRLGEVRDGAQDDEVELSVRESEPVTVGASSGPAGGDRASASATASGSGSGPAAGSEDDGQEDGAAARTDDESADGDDEAAQPVRAAQLARQREAVERRSRKKAREADPERSALRRSVLAEAGIAVVLLMVATGLTSTEPGRTAELTRSATSAGQDAGERLGPVKKKIPFDTGGKNGKGTADLWITPGQSGGNSLRVIIKDPDGKPLEASEVLVALTLRSKQLGPISVNFEPINGNKSRWRSQTMQVPLPGKWKAAVTLRTSDIDQITKRTTMRIH